MLQQNIETCYCKIGVITNRDGSVSVLTKGKTLFGTMPAQVAENAKNNLWDFGLTDGTLIKGADIKAIGFWDHSHTFSFHRRMPSRSNDRKILEPPVRQDLQFINNCQMYDSVRPANR